ncbi:MAG TPA: undecaprenyl-diphosphate phosphatase [Acidimicrobiia bacterium]|jgi:undecaprenyl-diphosphatase|nr:undecaprenyl-diphosphate phosphatase [Acidimicrobiia bacterium]
MHLAAPIWPLAQSTMSYLQAIVIGILQGITELFPVSSLGHSVLVPELLGWHSLVAGQAADESFYLAFLVGLHVATAIALVIFFWRDWVDVVRGFVSSIAKRRIDAPNERMAWLLVLGTIPVGIVGLVFEHNLRTLFAKPTAAAIFLCVNGLILLAGERLRRRAATRELVEEHGHHADLAHEVGRDLDTLDLREGLFIGSSQILALFAGISRSGVTMVAGLLRGLDHEDAARLSFMLATPVILAAGVYKLPDLLGHNGDHVRGQVLVGSLAAGIAAYISVRFLTRWFQTRTLTPFAIYSLAFGALMLVVTLT